MKAGCASPTTAGAADAQGIAPLTRGPPAAYSEDRATMRKLDPEERQVAKLELMAAAAIFLVAAIVLYMVFYYRPA